MNHKIIPIILFICLLVSSVSAEQEIIQNRPYNITYTVTINGVPTTSASCNVTVLDQDQISIVSQGIMNTNSASKQYSYALNRSQTSKLGFISYDIFCAGSGYNNTEHFIKPVSQSGQELTVAQSLMYIFVLILTIALFLLSLYGAIMIPSAKIRSSEGQVIDIKQALRHAKHFCILMCYLTLVWIPYIAWNIASGYLLIGGVALFFLFVHRILLVFLLPGILVYAGSTIYFMIKDSNIKKELERGIYNED